MTKPRLVKVRALFLFFSRLCAGEKRGCVRILIHPLGPVFRNGTPESYLGQFDQQLLLFCHAEYGMPFLPGIG